MRLMVLVLGGEPGSSKWTILCVVNCVGGVGYVWNQKINDVVKLGGKARLSETNSQLLFEIIIH